ncbi:MAG: NADH:ubiquinone oxidoreductase, partial [Anaerolineae bacterium]|nr:NADH:ubiquinone oxidoreductase [Anaerolineae bacterium]
LQFDQGDRLNGMISRADVAEVCVQALSYVAARNVTFEVIAGDGRVENQDWGLLFAVLTPDSQA